MVKPPPKYPVFGGAIPSEYLTGGTLDEGIILLLSPGSAFALALDAARPNLATLNAAPGTAAVVSEE